MPPRTRSSRAKKVADVTTTEELPETDPDTTPDTVPDTTPDDTDQEPNDNDSNATDERRKHVRPLEDAVFLSAMVEEDPPADVMGEAYTRAPGYDDGMDTLWQRYLDAGSPAWSASADPVEPDGGYYMNRKGIWFKAEVPDGTTAYLLVQRAARRIGCSYRFKSNPALPKKDEPAVEGPFTVWFTAAPLNKRKPKNKATDSTTDSGTDDDAAETTASA